MHVFNLRMKSIYLYAFYKTAARKKKKARALTIQKVTVIHGEQQTHYSRDDFFNNYYY